MNPYCRRIVIALSTIIVFLLSEYKAFANDDLKISLFSKQKYKTGETIELVSQYRNVGESAFSLTFWENIRLRILSAQGLIVQPNGGPTPQPGSMGAAEEITVLGSNQRILKVQHLYASQPENVNETVGWSYDLKPGVYVVSLIYESPPNTAWGRARLANIIRFQKPNNLWKGVTTSNEVKIEVEKIR